MGCRKKMAHQKNEALLKESWPMKTDGERSSTAREGAQINNAKRGPLKSYREDNDQKKADGQEFGGLT